MNNKKTWQEDLDKFLSESSPSIDHQVLARTYTEESDNCSIDIQEEHRTISQIEAAFHIEQHLDEIGLQTVPETLQNSLQNIGKDELSIKAKPPAKTNVIKANFKRFQLTISSLAACITIVAVMSMQLLDTPQNQQQPTVAEINQAQQELALAFNYLSAAKTKSTNQVKQTINLKLQQPMMKGLLHPLTLFKES